MAKVTWLLLVTGLSAGLAGCSTGPSPRPSYSSTPAKLGNQARADFDTQNAEALALLQSRDYVAASEQLQQLVNQYPQQSAPLTNLGIALAHLGRRDEAITQLRRAAQADRKNAVAWNWLGQQLRRAGDISGAESAYKAALLAQPDDAASHKNLAILYDVNLNQPGSALEHYRRYQALTGSESLIVEAWARAAQDRLDQTAMLEQKQ